MADISTFRRHLRRSVNGAQSMGGSIRRLGRLVLNDLQDEYTHELSARERLWYLRRGFVSARSRQYDFETYNYRKFLPDFTWTFTDEIHGSYQKYAVNKIAFYRLLGPDKPEVPNVFGVIDDGIVFSTSGDRLSTTPDEWLTELATTYDRVVCKPVGGSGGYGLHIVSSDGDGSAVTDAVHDTPYMVMPYLEQADYVADIYPEAANTIRAITAWDPDTGEPFLIQAVQRIGAEGTGGVDNWSQGGISAHIDRESGMITNAVRLEGGWSGPARSITAHPDTDTQIVGTQIPAWDDVHEAILDLAAEVRYLPYLGWDILVTNDGPRVLEANTRPDRDLMQVHKPMLKDPRAEYFFRHYNIV